jgi:hypothetical protein
MRDGSDSYDEEAATDGWRRMLAFLADHLGRTPPSGTWLCDGTPTSRPPVSRRASKPKGRDGSSGYRGRRPST